MEDNEFEEVTIISHTDRPQRVFSEKSIEKLKDQVSLEIVKEINGTEDKTYSDDPRLAPGLRELEKLKQDHFGEGEGKITPADCIYFISRVAGESGQYLLGASNSALVFEGRESKVIRTDTPVIGVISWNNHLLVLNVERALKVFENSVLDSKPRSVGYRVTPWNYYMTKDYFYYKTEHSSLGTTVARLDRDLKVEFIERPGFFQDFFVCPKTETITTLHSGFGTPFIQTNTQRFELQRVQMNSNFRILKKMYSDHFLVPEFRSRNTLIVDWRLNLVDADYFRILSFIEFQADSNFSSWHNIRLLAPRQGINCFLVAEGNLNLFCEYRLKLYHLKTLEIKFVKLRALSYQMLDLWTLGCHDSTILSVRVDFSKCPALQL